MGIKQKDKKVKKRLTVKVKVLIGKVEVHVFSLIKAPVVLLKHSKKSKKPPTKPRHMLQKQANNMPVELMAKLRKKNYL